MVKNRTDRARHKAERCPHDLQAPRAAAFCRCGLLLGALFASVLMVPGGVLPAAGSTPPSAPGLDAHGNGVEDILDRWLAGQVSWQDLRLQTRPARALLFDPEQGAFPEAAGEPGQTVLAEQPGPFQQGLVRVVALANTRSAILAAVAAGSEAGQGLLLHDLEAFGGVQVAALDEAGLQAFLGRSFDGQVLLDRDGLPALTQSCEQIGAHQVAQSHWELGDDWSATVAILDSGCDTAHGDLGDFAQDNQDGPPPQVGDADDWFSAANGWPLFEGYKVVGWHDVSDDFPEAQGPWDYHYHGTALASVVAGSGMVDPAFSGVTPGGRLTVVKFYDFDGVWHTWAGDFLAACAWTLENRETYRIRTVLTAVNWEVDLGISQAMAAFVEAGILPVAAMGNFGEDPAGPGYPARLPDVLTAGSVDPDGAVSAFSGRGLPGQTKPDLLAPGGHVIAADNEPDDTYSTRQGTSLAAAHLAGAAYLLEEALVDNGVHLPADRTSVLTRMALLRAATARVTQAALPGGQRLPLSIPDEPDQVRGWGLVRIDAAVRALFLPLFPGNDQSDTLSLDTGRPATSRRLMLNPGIRYFIEAIPQPGLDVAIEVVDPRQLDDDPFGAQVARENDNGPGVSEFIYHQATDQSWAFLVVRQVSGSGTVALRLREADSFPESSVLVQLPGNLTGAPNVGRLAGSPGPTIVLPSRVAVDNVARSVNVMDGTGVSLPGWPVFVFPNSSAQGGLTQPVVWDLDGVNGDEIVLSSGYGSVYFFNRLGAWFREDLGFNLPLTTAVGVEEISGQRRIVVITAPGVFHAWSWGPVSQVSRDLGITQPLDPAVGQLVTGPAEEVAIAFRNGQVLVTSTLGEPLPGWPVDLGTPLETPPVLCDLDGDGQHEIILPDLDHALGVVRFHVLDGQGQPGPGNGAQLAAPAGGDWLVISNPVVAGFPGGGDLRISVTGLMDNGQTGTRAGWELGQAALYATGQAQALPLPGFEVKATTSEGVLTLQHVLLPTPLAWDFLGGSGAEVSSQFSIKWTELLYGLTAIDGSASGIFQPTVSGRPLEGRTPLRPGGAAGTALASAGGALVNLDGEVFLQARATEDQLLIMPTRPGYAGTRPWASARSDQRNSGAYPLASELSSAPLAPTGVSRLQVYPNPGAGRFHFRLDSALPVGAEVKIYDVRGRRVRILEPTADKGRAVWDGTDSRGRRVAAGTYLAIVRLGNSQVSTRFVVTR